MSEPFNVFISWSGRRSRELAETMRRWLSRLFDSGQIGQLFLSSDMDKGRPWFEQLSNTLNQSHMALLCLTPENVSSPWMHFEAGAIAKTLFSPEGDPKWHPEKREPRIFTYLHQVRPGELSGPLGQYQATLATRGDTRRLVESLARLSPRPAEMDLWLGRFDELWPELEEAIRSIQPLMAEVIPHLEARFRRKTFREPLVDCTSQAWADRHAGARETLSQMQADAAIVEQRCRPFHVELFRDLLAELDGYAMTMAALLVGREPFRLNDTGRLDIDGGVREACERRRARIEELVSQMLDPLTVPALDESLQFVRAPTLEAKRSVLHRIKHEMGEWSEKRKTNAAEQRTSSWELDRIIAYLVQIERPQAEAREVLSAADSEVDRAYRKDSSRPPMALFYALRALEETLARRPNDRDFSVQKFQKLIERIKGPDAKVIEEERDEFQFTETLARLREHIARTSGQRTETNTERSPGAVDATSAPTRPTGIGQQIQ